MTVESSHRRQSGIILAAVVFTGCGFLPQKVSLDDQRIQPLLIAAASFDRVSHGFTPIPQTANDVRFESRPTEHYDSMLHISARTARTIAFRKNGSGYVWTGEQEIFEGPRRFKTVDGTFNEQITLTYEIEHISGAPLGQLYINYFGEEPTLNAKLLTLPLTLDDVRPFLKQWGY